MNSTVTRPEPEQGRLRRRGKSLPEQARLQPARGMARMIASYALAGLLTFGGLILASSLIDHCAQDARFCAAERVAGALEPTLERPVQTALLPEPELQPTEAHLPVRDRPVLAHAYEPLPFSLDSDSGRVFLLPPGRSLQDMATEQGAISVHEINLIAVVQQNGIRHALVRLPDGRILRLVQGDRLEDGTVAAISDDALYLLGPDMIPRAFLLGG